MPSAKSSKRYLLFIPTLFALIGAYIGAWLSLAEPNSVAQYSISGALVGAIAGVLLAMMVKSSVSVDDVAGEPEEVDERVQELERKKAFRYQRFDFANSALQTAIAILLVAIAYSVLGSIHHRSLLFFFFVVYPAISLASRLLFLSWGWVGRIVVLIGWPLLYVLAGIWLMVNAPAAEAGWGLLIIGMGVYTAYQSLQRFRKVKALIEKYPVGANQNL